MIEFMRKVLAKFGAGNRNRTYPALTPVLASARKCWDSGHCEPRKYTSDRINWGIKLGNGVAIVCAFTGCASNPSPAKTFQTWGHELAHVVCGRFHPTPGYDHTRAYKNVGSWDFSECRSGTYAVDVYLYDTYDDLRLSMSPDSRASQWAAGYQTRRLKDGEWRTEIHVLRPTTNY